MVKFKVGLTGLPDSRIAKTIKVGNKYRFFNGYMSKFDGKVCIVESITDSLHKFKVRFSDGLDILAYDSELEVVND
jgi:hypothetical protein